MAAIPAHFRFVAEQLKLLRDWKPRIADAESAEALVDAALAVYGTIHRTECDWAAKLSAGEGDWSNGQGRDIADLYRDWHNAASGVVERVNALECRNVPVRNADAIRDTFARVAALVDIGLDQVFAEPAPPLGGQSLREVRDGLQR